ncbi:MAG: XRE family transcriptional regulator [Candidatus Entotheonellia bacterium]
MAKPFSHLLDKMSPERRARVEARVQQAIQDMALAELRVARDLTQEHLSGLLGIKQSAVSKLERRTDMYVSTLRSFIKAMGGDLEIRAVFPDGTVRITQFHTLAEPHDEWSTSADTRGPT